MEQGFDTWQRGLHRAGCRVFAGYSVVVAVLQVRSLAVSYADGGDVSVAGVAGVVFLLAAAGRGFLGLTDSKDAVAFTVLLAVTAADPSPLDVAATGGDANPSFFIVAATFLVYIVTWRGAVTPAAIVAAALLYLGCTVLLGGREPEPVLDEMALLVTSDLAIWILFRELQLEARRADDAHYRAIHEQGVAARIAAEQKVTLAAQRTLHDRVLAVLLLLHTSGRHEPRRHLPDPPALREWCRLSAVAVRRLGSEGAVTGETTDLALSARIARETSAAAGSTGVVATVRHAAGHRPVPIPGQVADAISAAVAEALRNVGRHAGVDRAHVEVGATDDGGVRIEVVDRGRGMAPGAAAGFGLRHSVAARLREVGGDIAVDAPEGGGTRVALRWAPADAVPRPVPARPDGEAELTRVSPHPRGLATEFSAPLFLGTCYLAVRYPFEARPAWTDAAVFLGVLLYTACAIAVIPSPRALRLVHVAGFAALPGLLAAGLHLAGDGALLGFEAWIVGLAGFPLLVLAMARPLLPVMALALAESAVVIVSAVLDPTVSPLEVLAPVTQTPMFVGLLSYGVAAVRRVRTNAEAEERARAEAASRTQTAEARQRVIETHYTWLRSEVGPFLEGVAAGELDLDDTAVQGRASVLALAIRDELALPAQLDAEVRQLIASARDRGISVSTRAIDEYAAVPPELARILEVLVAADGLTEITVSLPREARPQLRVVVRPRLTPDQRARAAASLAHGSVEIDEDDLVSIISFTPGDRSPHGRR